MTGGTSSIFCRLERVVDLSGLVIELVDDIGDVAGRRIGLAELGAFTRDHEPSNVPGPFTVDRALRDVRRMFRLIGECRDLGADAEAWRRHGFEEVARLLGARGATRSRRGLFRFQPPGLQRREPGRPPTVKPAGPRCLSAAALV